MDYFRTFTRPSPSRNLTFDKDTADLLANLSLDKDDDWKNQTFTRKRLSRDSSEGFDYDDHVQKLYVHLYKSLGFCWDALYDVTR